MDDKKIITKATIMHTQTIQMVIQTIMENPVLAII